MPDENQEQSENQSIPTADETTQAEMVLEPVSDTSTTTPITEPEIRRKVDGVEDYESALAAALAPAAEEATAGENPPEADAPAEEPTQEVSREFRPRLSSLDARQKEAILLAKELKDKGEGITLSEAERRVAAKYGDSEEAVVPPEAAQERTMEAIQAEIDAKILEADESAESLDVKAALAAQREVSKLEREMSNLSLIQAESNQRAEVEFKDAVEASRARVLEVYPASQTADHALHAEATRIWADMEKQSNPLIFDAEAPFKVYQMAANALAIAPAAAAHVKSSTPATPKPRVVQQSAVLARPNQAFPVASGGERTTQPGLAATNNFGKIRNAHDYNKTLRDLGVSV